MVSLRMGSRGCDRDFSSEVKPMGDLNTLALHSVFDAQFPTRWEKKIKGTYGFSLSLPWSWSPRWRRGARTAQADVVEAWRCREWSCQRPCGLPFDVDTTRVNSPAIVVAEEVAVLARLWIRTPRRAHQTVLPVVKCRWARSTF